MEGADGDRCPWREMSVEGYVIVSLEGEVPQQLIRVIMTVVISKEKMLFC